MALGALGPGCPAGPEELSLRSPEQSSDTEEVAAEEEEFLSGRLIGPWRGPSHHEPFKSDEEWSVQQPAQ